MSHLRRLLVLVVLLGGCQPPPTVSLDDGGTEVVDGGAVIDPSDGGVLDEEFEGETAWYESLYEWLGDRDVTVPPIEIVEPDDALEPSPVEEPERIDPDGETGDGVITARAFQTTYRVLHWNIAGGKVHDCRTAAITAAVRRIVNEHDIQFVGLNEVCPTQYDAIRDELRSVWGLGAGATFSAFVGDGSPRVVGNAIFSRFPLEDVSRLQVGNDRFGARNLLCGRVSSRSHLRFCSTHLTPGADARTQLGRVKDRLERWWDDRRDTVILTGDLNLRSDDRALNTIYAEQANTRNNPNNHGAYHELDDDDDAHCRGYGERSTPNTTGGPCNDGGKIDFIFVRRSRIAGDRQYGADAMNIPNTCGGLCSDHRPVRGRVRVLVRED